ncbi:hypothetical protein I308_103313 [Cryptococcus tetragattii IND107]|uniref:Uncharacterized protein n=1 Tax=Cryptococcus tetragattii IND107 TaxID=1296105 RepID=A0ABR3BSS9_9TREE
MRSPASVSFKYSSIDNSSPLSLSQGNGTPASKQQRSQRCCNTCLLHRQEREPRNRSTARPSAHSFLLTSTHHTWTCMASLQLFH